MTPTSDLPYDFREMETNCFFAGQEDTPNYDSPFKPNMEHENQHRVQVSSPKNPPWPAAMLRFHQRCNISSRAQGCTSSNRGFDFEGISLRFPRFGSKNWNNKQDQTRCLRDPRQPQNYTEVTNQKPTRLRHETPMVDP